MVYGLPYMRAHAASTSGTEASIVLRGLSPRELRRQAIRECERRLGAGSRFTEERIVPCMVSLGGRVRLYEGRFQVSRG